MLAFTINFKSFVQHIAVAERFNDKNLSVKHHLQQYGEALLLIFFDNFPFKYGCYTLILQTPTVF